MEVLSDRKKPYLWILLSIFFLFSQAGCEQCSSEPETSAEHEQAAKQEPVALADEVVAVLRLEAMNLVHFDHRSWRRKAIEAGLIELDGQGRGIPTARLRTFLEEILGPDGTRVRWDGHLDVVVWAPEEEGGDVRWAVAIPWAESQSLQGREDWIGEGQFRSGDGPSAETVPVFSRDHQGNTYYFAEMPTTISRSNTIRGTSIVVSSFPRGAVRLGEAVETTGTSGIRAVELYLWPRRTGIANRYREAAELIEQRMATSGHDLLPARVGLLQLQAQMYRALGNAQNWPELTRIVLDADRDADSPNMESRRVFLSIDFSAHQGVLLSALWNALRDTNLELGPQVKDPAQLIQLTLRPREMATLGAVLFPDPWLQLMSVRSAGTRNLLVNNFNDLLLHNRGPMTVAFYDRPRSLSGEFFLGFQAIDREELNGASYQFHHRFLRDFWMPMFDILGIPDEERFAGEMGGEEVEFYSLTFLVGHGSRTLGVCWTIRGREYLSYYGVNPCDQLKEVFDLPDEGRSGAPLSYEGAFATLVDKLFILPGDRLERGMFQGVDLRLWGVRKDRQRIEITANITELEQLGVLIEDLQKMPAHWHSAAALDPAQIALELSLQQVTYQEPGLSLMGVPGIGGVMPPSILLGLPFSFGPTPPSLFRDVYFGNEIDHHHH